MGTGTTNDFFLSLNSVAFSVIVLLFRYDLSLALSVNT